MAGLRSGSNALSALFAARVTTKGSDVGILDNVTDISNTYEKILSATPIAATGWKTSKSPYAANTDLANIFRGINLTCTSYDLVTDGSGNGAATWTCCDGGPGSTSITGGTPTAVYATICALDGTLNVTAGSSNNNGSCDTSAACLA
jgi:hypothetical protein